jgi:predicted RNase H-like HicB family nuclease
MASETEQRNSMVQSHYTVIDLGKSIIGSACVPDLPGRVAIGRPVAEAKEQVREALAFHLDGLREDGVPLADRTSTFEHIELAAQAPAQPLPSLELIRGAGRCPVAARGNVPQRGACGAIACGAVGASAAGVAISPGTPRRANSV